MRLFRTAKAAPSDQSRVLNHRPDICNAFRLFRDQRIAINLRLNGHTAELPAHILDVTEREILLERLRPSSNNKLVRDAGQVTFAGRAEGIYLFATDIPIKQLLASDGIPYFRAPLPREIMFQQRRRSERVAVARRVSGQGAMVHIQRGAELLEGQLVDISVGGCRVRINDAVDGALRNDEQIPNCRVYLTPELRFDVPAVVRHQAHNKKSNHLFCGLEFQKLDVADRRRLEKYIDRVLEQQRGSMADNESTADGALLDVD